LASRWRTDEQIEANYLRNPTVAGYNELIKKMLQSAVIGKFTTALGAITLSDVNAGNIGSYDGAKNWVYASEARDPKFMGRAFKKYIDNQLANPSSALARAVAQAVVPALTRPYVNYKEMLVVLKNETRQYITKYFAAPNGYACNINNVQITVSDFANAVADMVYQSFKVNSEEQLLPTMAGQQQVQVLAGSPRESFR
jgi:hypothetical protein